MRLRARVDATQKTIVCALRGAGCQVLHLHAIGKGCPDILIKHRGVLYLCEIKAGKGWSLTKDQKVFHADWGPVLILDSVESAILWINSLTR